MTAAFSKNFDRAQQNYSITDKELLGIVKSIEHFRHYFLEKEFFLKTNKNALAYLQKAKNQNSRVLRYASKMQEYTFRVENIKGKTNVADGTSRIKTVAAIKEKGKNNFR